VATGRAERDLAADLRGALTPVKTINRAAIIEPKKVGELLRAIDDYQRLCCSMRFKVFSLWFLFVRGNCEMVNGKKSLLKTLNGIFRPVNENERAAPCSLIKTGVRDTKETS